MIYAFACENYVNESTSNTVKMYYKYAENIINFYNDQKHIYFCITRTNCHRSEVIDNEGKSDTENRKILI